MNISLLLSRIEMLDYRQSPTHCSPQFDIECSSRDWWLKQELFMYLRNHDYTKKVKYAVTSKSTFFLGAGNGLRKKNSGSSRLQLWILELRHFEKSSRFSWKVNIKLKEPYLHGSCGTTHINLKLLIMFLRKCFEIP